MNTGLERKLQVLDSDKNVVWDADLVEDGDPGDPEAAKYRDYIPTWHGLSKDGDVQGQLIYANYGTQEDYQNLLSVGTDFKGKIVLVRYGAIFRGLKVRLYEKSMSAGSSYGCQVLDSLHLCIFASLRLCISGFCSFLFSPRVCAWDKLGN